MGLFARWGKLLESRSQQSLRLYIVSRNCKVAGSDNSELCAFGTEYLDKSDNVTSGSASSRSLVSKIALAAADVDST